MNKKKVPLCVAIFFLVHVISASQVSHAETYLLNPPTKVSLNEPNVWFQQLCATVCVALSIYKADAVAKHPKETLAREFGMALPGDVRFDLEHIGMGRKGWTRYYPVYIGDKPFIVRIFLTEERAYQPDATVLFEASVRNPAVTIQVLPGLNEILKDCRIKPHTFYPSSHAAATSP